MIAFVKTVGVCLTLLGLLGFFKPKSFKAVGLSFLDPENFRITAIIPGIIGILLIVASFRVTSSLLVLAVGLLFVSKVLIIALLDRDNLRAVLNWFQKAPLVAYRIFGVTALVIGLSFIIAS